MAGVRAVHAVDAAGVHPLLLAIGSERYTPYNELRRPQELLTQANALLGQGQMSLAKYLLIIANEDAPGLDIHGIGRFLEHLLARADWRRDLHFQTRTTIDTLDYSGSGLNEGSKVVIAAAGKPIRDLPRAVPSALSLPAGFAEPRVALPGALVICGPRHGEDVDTAGKDRAGETLCNAIGRDDALRQFPLIVVVDDSEFAARNLNNFLWVTFTRSNPAADIHGVEAFVEDKHWGCRGSLVIDARAEAASCAAHWSKIRRSRGVSIGWPLAAARCTVLFDGGSARRAIRLRGSICTRAAGEVAFMLVPLVILGWCFVTGACVGSFLNVVAWRLRKG